NSAEMYEPATGTWTVTGNLNFGRPVQTPTLLTNGKIFVAGGADDMRNKVTNRAESYDPATGSWSNTGNLVTARAEHTAALLPNGKVLVAGGFVDYGSGQVTNGAELYDPDTGTWSSTGNLNQRRALHTATLLTPGKVLVAGGFFTDGLPNISDRSGFYDPPTATWSSPANLNSRCIFHSRTPLP